MKKLYILIIAVLFVSLSSSAQYTTGYYKAMDGKKKEALKAAAKQCVQNHIRLDYNDLPNNWRYTDVYPERYDGDVRWWEMYSNNIYLIKANQTPRTSFSANKMQREHSVPKSWWKKNNDVEYTPAYTDLWNLYPSDGECNQAKNNYPFGEVQPGKAIFDNGSGKVGMPIAGQGGTSALVFEPADEYKGDFARTIFYMATVYDDLPWANSVSYNMFVSSSWPTLKSWAIETLLKWHLNDPVSQKEIDRNNAVEMEQGNRNPFIDFPKLAEYIWGELSEQIFYIDAQGGSSVPYPDKAYIEEPVNGEYLDFGQCAQNGAMTTYLEINGMITEALSISLSGTDRSMFTLGITSVKPNQLNQSQHLLVPIIFNPTELGERTANLLLYDGGLDGSIRVTLRGECVAVPELSRLTAYEATNVTEDSYVANWSVAPEVVDYYVVNRKIIGYDGTQEEQMESSTNSLLIVREDNLTEIYTVCSSRLGYLSEASNAITVAGDTGIFRVDAPGKIDVRTNGDGFEIIGDCESLDIAVYDLAGRLIVMKSDLTPFEHVSLPSGLYIVTSSYLNRPFKILIP